MIKPQSIQNYHHQNGIFLSLETSSFSCHVLIAYPRVHLIHSKLLSLVITTERTLLRSLMRVLKILQRVSWPEVIIFIVISKKTKNEVTKSLTMGFMIYFICFHVKKRVHEWISHEKSIEVLIHTYEIVFASPA